MPRHCTAIPQSLIAITKTARARIFAGATLNDRLERLAEFVESLPEERFDHQKDPVALNFELAGTHECGCTCVGGWLNLDGRFDCGLGALENVLQDIGLANKIYIGYDAAAIHAGIVDDVEEYQERLDEAEDLDTAIQSLRITPAQSAAYIRSLKS